MKWIDLEPGDIINFPKGTIKKVNEIIKRAKLDLIVINPTIRRNIAYTIQFINVIKWMLKQTTIDLTAKEQLIKYAVIAINSIAEAIVVDYLENRPPKIKINKKFSKNIDKLRQKGVPTDIIDNLQLLREKRSKIHLYLWRDELEHMKYSEKDYKRAVKTLVDLLEYIYRNR